MEDETEYSEELDELNFYSEDIIERLLEEDELTTSEAGFMRGYDSSEDSI